MPNYRRAFAPGGCWFFTVNLLDRRRRLLTDNVDALREATRLTQTRHPFKIDAMVVLPDHIHAVWTLPPGDADFSLRWRLIKIDFAKAVPKTERRSPVRIARGERAIWQRRFWGEHLIRDDEDFRRHVEYCYINPVKHGLVTRVRDWPHSSFHRDVRAELFSGGLGGRRLGRGQLRRACLRWSGAMRFAYCALRRSRRCCATRGLTRPERHHSIGS